MSAISAPDLPIGAQPTTTSTAALTITRRLDHIMTSPQERAGGNRRSIACVLRGNAEPRAEPLEGILMTRFLTMRTRRQQVQRFAALVIVAVAVSGTAMTKADAAVPPVSLGRPNPEGTSI
jgi:hypothetical protein